MRLRFVATLFPFFAAACSTSSSSTPPADASLDDTTADAGDDPGSATCSEVCDAGTFCAHAACIGGTCQTASIEEGTATPNQTKGDCKSNVCDGDGGVKTVGSSTDLPADDGNPCTDEACDISNTPIHPPSAKGKACGATSKCDGNGNCYACLADSDCPLASPVCSPTTHACIAVGEVFVGVTTGNVAYGAALTGAKWPLTQLGADIFDSGGGGVVVPDAQHAVVVLRGNGNAVPEAALWSGAWAPLAALSPTVVSYVSSPAFDGSGVAIAYQSGSGAAVVDVNRFTVATSAWSGDESTGGIGSNILVPSVAQAGGGELVLFDHSDAFQFVASTGPGAWGSAGAVSGVAHPVGALGMPAVLAVRRAGSSDVVAFFSAVDGASKTTISYAVYSGGAWSGAAPLVSGASMAFQGRAWDATSLRDGRIAFVYVDTPTKMHVAIFDGTAWDAFQTVPGTPGSGRFPVAIAAGTGGSTIDLAFVDASGHAQRTRLLDPVSWIWNGDTIDATQTYDMIDLGVSP